MLCVSLVFSSHTPGCCRVHHMLCICIYLSSLSVSFALRPESAMALLFSCPAPYHLSPCITYLPPPSPSCRNLACFQPNHINKTLKICNFIQDYLSSYLCWSGTVQRFRCSGFPRGSFWIWRKKCKNSNASCTPEQPHGQQQRVGWTCMNRSFLQVFLSSPSTSIQWCFFLLVAEAKNSQWIFIPPCLRELEVMTNSVLAGFLAIMINYPIFLFHSLWWDFFTARYWFAEGCE